MPCSAAPRPAKPFTCWPATPSNSATAPSANSSASVGARAFRLDLEADRLGEAEITREAVRTGIEDADTAISITDTVASDTFTASTGTLSATDVDAGTTLTYGIATITVTNGVATKVGTYGTLAVTAATGAYTFTPNAAAINALAANTTETFTVTVSDGTALTTASYTVNLTAVNDAPRLASIAVLTGATEDTAYEITYAALAAAGDVAAVVGVVEEGPAFLRVV